VSFCRFITRELPPNASEGQPSGLDLSDRPFVAGANILAAVVLEILRPLCWEALILLWLLALFTPE
jgi:hypothetical protein